MRISLFASLLVLTFAGAANAQSVIQPPPGARTVNLSGPRFGITALPPGVVAALQERSIDVRPAISQFGWQFEKQFYAKEGGVAAVTEWVTLIGGLDQGLAIPSVSWLVGLRTKEGTEFGIGPNVSPSGVALALAAGVTLRTGFMNVPLNVAVVPSKRGSRVSILTGFNMRTR